MKYLVTVVIVVAVFTAGVLLYAWSGIYNIAATEPHWPVTLSFIELLKNRSIEAHAENVQAPSVNEEKLEEAAFPHYHEMCRLCHGAPGFDPEEFAMGLYPSPPSMTSGKIQESGGADEFYWIVKHGIKMTGMPAFGPTHDEKALWGLVALVEEMPQMSPERYKGMVESLGSEGHGVHAHEHKSTEGEKSQEDSPDEHTHQGESDHVH